MEVVYLVIIVILILLIFKPKCPEGLVSKPSNQEINKFTNEIIQNRELFGGNSTFYIAREKMPWIDPIAYEDIRMLARQNILNKDSLTKVFH